MICIADPYKGYQPRANVLTIGPNIITSIKITNIINIINIFEKIYKLY